ncbi:bifunctional ornithine acetyltransferase/N-acetylglutamate synthase, partial [Klebsiella pneumoniae]|uniref:bifunctional ornithine acetyltransferase/N-acetylglutamate synthase n=1 Tax=Klebsiella pneumoniae TaxID=573 RepID=UPI0039C09253
LGCRPEQVLPFSTGVIMETLPVDRIVAGLPAALEALKADHWAEAAAGIMTTDTVPKVASRRIEIAGVAGTPPRRAQGAGRVRPHKAAQRGGIATQA